MSNPPPEDDIPQSSKSQPQRLDDEPAGPGTSKDVPDEPPGTIPKKSSGILLSENADSSDLFAEADPDIGAQSDQSSNVIKEGSISKSEVHAVDQDQDDDEDSDIKLARLEARKILNTSSAMLFSNMEFCRICHEAGEEERLISPCRCRGSLSLVHRSCLERWLAEADSTTCELCGFTFTTKRLPRYSLVKSIWAWFRSADTRRERRELLFDLLACVTFTPVAAIGTYIGLLMAESLYTGELEDPRGTLANLPGRLATLSVVSLMTTLDLAFISWMALRAQYHVSQWYNWYRRNCKVLLLSPLDLKDNSSPPFPNIDD